MSADLVLGRLGWPIVILFTLFAAAPAKAMPVPRPVSLSLEMATASGTPHLPLVNFGPITVDVDETAGTIAFTPGVLGVLPVLTPPPIQTGAVTATAVSYGAANLALGAAVPSGELCATSTGNACVEGGGLGGTLALGGNAGIHVIPSILVIPIDLGVAGAGVGGATLATNGFAFDAAPWTLGTARVSTSGGTFSRAGALGPNDLTLVTPIYVEAFGTEMPIFAELTISFLDGGGVPAFVVPEPGIVGFATATLLAAAMARTRERRRRRV